MVTFSTESDMILYVDSVSKTSFTNLSDFKSLKKQNFTVESSRCAFKSNMSKP